MVMSFIKEDPLTGGSSCDRATEYHKKPAVLKEKKPKSKKFLLMTSNFMFSAYKKFVTCATSVAHVRS